AAAECGGGTVRPGVPGELARLRLGERSVRESAHHDRLAAERPCDDDLVAGADGTVGPGCLSVDVDAPGLAGPLRFGACPEQAGDVQPDVEANALERLAIRHQMKSLTFPRAFS